MITVKLVPSAEVDIEILDRNGVVVERQKTHNALLSSFTYGIGRGAFSRRFSVRLGSSTANSNYYDTFLYAQLPIGSQHAWPLATAESTWPTSTITSDSRIKWSTTQVFETVPGSIVGTINEIGFNFYGDNSNEIHARALTASPVRLSAEHVMRIRYTLNFYTANEDLTYTVNSVYGNVVTQHAVTQRWANRCTLWDMIGVPPGDLECSVYGGDLNGYDVEPQDYLGASIQAYMDSPDDTTSTLVAVIDADSGNSLTGIKTLKFTTFPVKMSFDPAISKSNSKVMTVRLNWVLG